MKHVKLFEQFILESELEKFYKTKVKNPKTGRKVYIKTVLKRPDHPLYKKLKAAEEKLKGGSDGGSDEIKKAEAQLKELQADYSDKAAEMADIRSYIVDLKNDIKDSDDEDFIEMTQMQLEDSEEELEMAQAELDKISSDIDDIKDFIKKNK